MNRREIVRLLTLAGGAIAVSPRLPAAKAPPPGIPDGIGEAPDYLGPLPKLSLGRKPALRAEERVARAVLEKSPTGPTPFAVARYFLDVGRGDHGEDWRPYIMGWPERWNPVIVEFFHATQTKPEGDVTAWCAAFVNWCVRRAGRGRATGSASSGSFRCFGEQTVTPRLGDIVVYRQLRSEDKCGGKGHVGFFVRDAGDYIEVLGGNQIHGRERNHMISAKLLRKAGTVLEFHSFRTDPKLHPVPERK